MKKESEIKISLNLDKSNKNSGKSSNKKSNEIFDTNEIENINKGKDYIEYDTKDNIDLDGSIQILNNHNSKLNNERETRIGKTFNEAKKERIERIQEETEKKITIKKLAFSIIIILIIILIYLFFEYAPVVGIRLPSNLSKQININIVSTNNDIYNLYNDELLVYSNHIISTYNKKGKKTWEYSLDTSFNPEIYIYGKYMVISNNSNGIIYLFNEKKETLNMKVDGTIEYIYMDDRGNIAVEYATNSYKKIIGVYDKNGKNKYNTYLEYTAIVDIKILNNAEKLLIVQADSNSFKVGCSISILEGASEQKNMQQILKLDNSFIYSIKQVNNNLILLLDNSIIKYNIETGEQKEIKKFDSSQVLFVTLLDKYYTFIEKSLDDNKLYNIVTKDYNNIEISTTNIENSPKFVVSSGNLNYCIYQNKLQVINKWGIEVLSKDIEIVPKNIIIFNNNKSAALIYTNKIEIINL